MLGSNAQNILVQFSKEKCVEIRNDFVPFDLYFSTECNVACWNA